MAYQKYLEATFLINELLRYLRISLKFSTDTGSQPKENVPDDSSKIESFSFVPSEDSGLKCLFDLSSEETLRNLRQMVKQRMTQV